MLKTVFVSALIALSGAAAAQTAAPAAPAAQPDPLQVALQTNAMAFGQCVVGGIAAVPATVTPQAGASQIMGNCNAQKLQLVQAAEAMIAALPEDRRATATAALQTRLASAEGEIAEEITRRRAAPAAPATTPAGR